MQPRHPLDHPRPEPPTSIWLLAPPDRSIDPVGPTQPPPRPSGPGFGFGRLSLSRRAAGSLLNFVCYLVAAASLVLLAASVAEHAETVGSAQAFAALMATVTALSASVTLTGLIQAVLLLRGESRPRRAELRRLRGALALAAGGFAGLLAALLLWQLSAAGQIPIP